MSIQYNGTSISKINYNDTDITVVTVNNTPIWGKSYTLTISNDINSMITVTRTSSPNQHAQLSSLSTGSTIYYGDTLTITCSAINGYSIETSTINGQSFTDTTTITITSDITINVTSMSSKSWHTVWSGTQVITNFNGATTFNGVLANAEKTRISGTVTANVYIEGQITFESNAFNTTHIMDNNVLNVSVALTYNGEFVTFENQSSTFIPTNYPIYISFQSVSDNTLHCTAVTSYADYPYSYDVYHGLRFISQGIKITKIEQYY